MEEYKNDIFYYTRELDLKTKRAICDYAYKRNTNFQVDILDCNVSWQRQYVEMSYEEVMKKLKQDTFFRVILRRGYDKPKGEVVFRTMEIPDYFLWLNITVEDLEQLLKEFGIEDVI